MNLAEQFPNPASHEAVDELLLRVAQRADQLAQTTDHGRERDLENWLQAERETLAKLPLSELTSIA